MSEEKDSVIQAIEEGLANLQALPDDSYAFGRVTGLLSAAFIGRLISFKEREAFRSRVNEIRKVLE